MAGKLSVEVGSGGCWGAVGVGACTTWAGGVPAAAGKLPPRHLPMPKPTISPMRPTEIAIHGLFAEEGAEDREELPPPFCGVSCQLRGVIRKKKRRLNNSERTAHHAH